MKDKPIVIYITLIAGLIACICCILNNAGLLHTLLYTLITLFVFMIIGMIANKVISGINHEVEEKEKAERERLEEEEREKLRLEEEAREAAEQAAREAEMAEEAERLNKALKNEVKEQKDGQEEEGGYVPPKNRLF